MTIEMRNQEPLSVDIKRYWGILKRWWWLIILLSVIGGAASYIFSTNQPEVFESKATIMITRPQLATDFESTFSNESIAKTYSRLIVQHPTLEGVIQKLSLDVSITHLQNNLKVSVIPDTQLLELRFEDTDPSRAKQVVNTIGQVFAEENEELQASRYQEMKSSLESQMENINQQIERTNQTLASITGEDVDPQETILQTKLTIYREIYQSLLRQTIEAETLPEQESVKQTSSAIIEEQLALLKQKIEEIDEEMATVGWYEPEHDMLQIKIDAYSSLYKSLVQDLALEEMNASIQQGQVTADNTEALSRQLETISLRIQETAAELKNIGGTVNGSSQQDRLEANLVLYQQTYSNLVQSYEEIRLAEVQNTTTVDLVQPAVVPTKPIRPEISQNTMMGVVIGIVAAVGIVFLIEILDDTIKTPEDVARYMSLPVLGVIFKHQTKNIISIEQPRSPVSEAFRSIRTSLSFASVDFPLKNLLITSPSPEDGKTTVAANLGVVFAQGDHEVMLLDADMRRPKLHKMLDIPNRQGLSDAFQSKRLDGLIQKGRVNGLSILPAGPLPPNPSELLASDAMFSLLQQVDTQSDIVIIDTPPISLVTDATILAHQADCVVIVVKPGVTKRTACQRAVEQLNNVGANVLGVVLNEVEPRQTNYYYKYNGYYYYSKNDAYYGTPKKK